MNKSRLSKDEFFLLKLHELALAQGSYDHPVDRFAIGRAIGQNDKGVNTIVRQLTQTNFILKDDPNLVTLTAHGLKLVQLLLRDSLLK